MSVGTKTPVVPAKPPKAQPRWLSVLRHMLPFIILFVACLLAPRFAGDREITKLIYIGIAALLAIGLNLLMGYAGQISLGHAAFFGMGAYTSAILTTRPMPGEVIPGFSAGLGVMAGCAILIGSARLMGWRLGSGALLLIVLSWLAGRLALPGPLEWLCFVGLMTGHAVLARYGWWKGTLSGVGALLATLFCQSSLSTILKNAGTSPWTAMLVGIVFTSLVAYLIGGQVLRLKGHYLAMATLGFGIIVEIIFRQWTDVTGGSSDGIFGIADINVVESAPGFIQKLMAFGAGGQPDASQQHFYLVWGFVILALIVASNIVRSRVGRALRAVHGSEVAAESLGVDTERYKVQVFVLSAAFASLAGTLHAHNAGIGYINPSEFSFMVSVHMVVMVVVGGMASVWGALLGATVIELLKAWLLTIEKTGVHLGGVELKGLDPIVFGAVLIIVMIVLPQGVVRGLTDLAAAAWRTWRRGHARLQSGRQEQRR